MKCKKCNNELITYQEGNTIEYICPTCDEEPATQAENLIEFDSNRYVVFIYPVGEYEKDKLREVASICSCNVLQAKKILEDSGYEFKAMDALETRRLKLLLEEKQIKFEISPDFRW